MRSRQNYFSNFLHRLICAATFFGVGAADIEYFAGGWAVLSGGELGQSGSQPTRRYNIISPADGGPFALPRIQA
ncbi:MAG TPA: hypothetical protein VNL17_06385 [Verrucomicrobiae bacterium]|nr:hypothetical protein [Verrucomicrobiae bacterium]